MRNNFGDLFELLDAKDNGFVFRDRALSGYAEKDKLVFTYYSYILQTCTYIKYITIIGGKI